LDVMKPRSKLVCDLRKLEYLELWNQFQVHVQDPVAEDLFCIVSLPDAIWVLPYRVATGSIFGCTLWGIHIALYAGR
jgi:hypothetical protein